MPEAIAEQEQELTQQALTIVERAQLVRIIDQRSYDSATSLLLKEIKPLRSRWKTYWDEVKRPLRQAVDAVQAKFNAGEGPLALAEGKVKAEITRWDTEQQRIQQELQRKAQEEEERRAEEERDRAAIVAENAGATEEEVQAIVEAPVLAIAPPVQPTYQRAAGVSKTDNFKARVTDLKALCRAVGAGKCSVEYVMGLVKDKDTGIISSPTLNARAKADKSTLNIPGVVPYNQPFISGRPR
jgi:hypothetical protein